MENRIKPLHCGPIVKGVEDNLSARSIRVWGRCKVDEKPTYIVARYCEIISVQYSLPIYLRVEKEHDGTGVIQFDNLSPGTDYCYQIGYYIDTGSYDLIWPQTASGRFKTDPQSNEPWNFSFGSCRLCARLLGLTFFGTGNNADKMYEAVLENNPQFWLEIGDQVYYDYLGNFMRSKTAKQMRKCYKKVRSYPHQKFLIANKTIYNMCDDHDLHRNNTDYAKMLTDIDAWEAGKKVFREYQHIKGPLNLDPLYYSFNRNNATFFVADTRSERSEVNIISSKQMSSIQSWLEDSQDKIKFFVSPTPVISQSNSDSWSGYPSQQKRLVKMLLIAGDTHILTGDAHCCRTGIYNVYDEQDNIGEIIEIVSSGISAVMHDRGKKYDMSQDSDPKDYDNDNDFPLIVDNSDKAGLSFRTIYSTEAYPKNSRNILKHVIKGATDHVFTDITVDNDILLVRVINSKKQVLNTFFKKK